MPVDPECGGDRIGGTGLGRLSVDPDADGRGLDVLVAPVSNACHVDAPFFLRGPQHRPISQPTTLHTIGGNDIGAQLSSAASSPARTDKIRGEGRFELNLGHILDAAGFPQEDTLVIRHTYKEDGLRAPDALTPEGVRDYTRGQLVRPGKFPAEPPRWWVVFVADVGRRARLYTVYDNAGEVAAERTPVDRFYDLRGTDVLGGLQGRLLIEWTKDTINWAKSGARAWSLPVLEVAGARRADLPNGEVGSRVPFWASMITSGRSVRGMGPVTSGGAPLRHERPADRDPLRPMGSSDTEFGS